MFAFLPTTHHLWLVVVPIRFSATTNPLYLVWIVKIPVCPCHPQLTVHLNSPVVGQSSSHRDRGTAVRRRKADTGATPTAWQPPRF